MSCRMHLHIRRNDLLESKSLSGEFCARSQHVICRLMALQMSRQELGNLRSCKGSISKLQARLKIIKRV
jgi:hypothetical protein